MPEDQKRNRLPMMIRFNAEERALLDTEARAQAMATGTWIRTTALQAARENARRRKKDGPAAPPHRPVPSPNSRGAFVQAVVLDEVAPFVATDLPAPSSVERYLALAREFNATPEGPEANALAVELQRIWDGMSEAEQEEARARL